MIGDKGGLKGDDRILKEDMDYRGPADGGGYKSEEDDM